MSARRATTRAAGIVAAGLLVFLSAGSAAAGPGDVEIRDRVNFTAGGNAVDGFATGLAVQPDGKVDVAGQVSNGSYSDFRVLRFNPDGSFDTSFGSNGAAAASFGANASVGDTLVLPSGKILVVGNAQSGSSSALAAAQFLPTGQLDSGFGTGGKLVLPIGVGNDSGEGVALQNGKPVIVGDVQNGSSDLSGFIVRLNADGTVDSSFNSGHPLITKLGATEASFADVIIKANNDIVVAGGALNGSYFDFAIARYMPDGAPDMSFGSGGRIFVDFGGPSQASRIVFDPAGPFYYAFGTMVSGPHELFALTRFSATGVLDPTFNTTGKVVTAIGTDSLGSAAVLQPDRKLIGIGSANSGNFDFGLVRYNLDGSLDTSFGNGGKVTTDFSGGNDDPEAAAIGPDGKLVVGGSSLNLTTNHFGFAWARYDLSNPPSPPPPPPPPEPSYNEDQDTVIHNLQTMDAVFSGLVKSIRSGRRDGRAAFDSFSLLAQFKRWTLLYFPPVFGRRAADVYPALEDVDAALDDAADDIYYDSRPMRDVHGYDDLSDALGAMKRAFPQDGSYPSEATSALNAFADGVHTLQGQLLDDESGKQALNPLVADRIVSDLGSIKFELIRLFPNVFGISADFVYANYEGIDTELEDAYGYLPFGRKKALSYVEGAVAHKLALEHAFEKTFVPYTPPAPPKFPLNVANFASDGGTVRSEPDGNIGCPPRCSHDYDSGTKVGLRADPKPGYRFVRWVGGPCTGSVNVKTCTVVMDAPRTIRAEFEKIPGPCECSSIALDVKSYSDFHGRPGNHAARLVLGLRWSMICSGGKGDSCRGSIKVSPPKGTDLRLVSPAGDITCSGACNAKVFTRHIGGARLEFRSAHDFLPDERANKTFNFKLEKFCLQNGKERLVGTSTLTLAYNRLGELDKQHSNLGLDRPRPAPPLNK